MNRSMKNYDSPREQLIDQYVIALETGDLDSQEQILTQAMAAKEPSLEMALWEVQIAVGSELLEQDRSASAISEQSDAEMILTVARSSFSTPAGVSRNEVVALQSALMTEDELFAEQEPPPLTLRDVAARLRVDMVRMPTRVVPAMRDLVARIEARHNAEPIEKEYLTERGALSLLGRLGFVGVSSWIGKKFHEILLSLQISREQELRLAAARRSHHTRQTTLPNKVSEKADPKENTE